MIESILNSFFRNTVYIKFTSDWMTVKHVETGKIFEDKPLLAVLEKKGKNIVAAVGANAEKLTGQNNINIRNGLEHPRVCIGDFEIAEATLKHFIRKAINKKVLVRPIIIMHPLNNLEGGISQIEYRAIKELAISCGSRKTYIWTGRELKDKELFSLDFPLSEGTLKSD